MRHKEDPPMQNILLVVLILVFLAISVAVIVAVFYFLDRWMEMPPPIPAPVRRWGQRDGLIYVVGMFAVFGLLTFGIWAIFQQPVASSAIIAFGICMIFLFIAFFFSWLHAKAKSGSVLLDCGESRFGGIAVRQSSPFSPTFQMWG
jgi:hypothetical protein